MKLTALMACLLLAGCAGQEIRGQDRAQEVASACRSAGFSSGPEWDACVERVWYRSGPVSPAQPEPQKPSIDWGRVADALLKGAAVMGAYQASLPPPPPPPKIVNCRVWPPGGNNVTCTSN